MAIIYKNNKQKTNDKEISNQQTKETNSNQKQLTNKNLVNQQTCQEKKMLMQNDLQLELYTSIVNQSKNWYHSKVRIEKVNQNAPRKKRKFYFSC